MKFNLVESLLLEDLEAVRERYPSIPDDIFDTLISLDPTFNKEQDKLGTYGKWLLDKFKAGTITDADFGHIKDALSRFEGEKKNLKNKDIYQFKTVSAIDDYLNDKDNYKELSHRQEVRQRQDARKNADLATEADKVFDNGEWEIWVPLSYAASCKLGQGTRWCTASTETDHYYNSYKTYYGGNYWIIINKNTPEEKYQFHFESDQFMDADDYSISLFDFYLDHPDIHEFFSNLLLKEKIEPQTWGYVYTTLTSEDEKVFNEEIVKNVFSGKDFLPVTIHADDLHTKKNRETYDFSIYISGDFWGYYDWETSWFQARDYIDTIDDHTRECLSALGLPKDIYEQMANKDDDEIEVFDEEKDGKNFVDNDDMISSLRDCIIRAVESGLNAGAESEAIKGFDKALKNSLPTGTSLDENSNLYCGDDKFVIDVFPEFVTENGIEEFLTDNENDYEFYGIHEITINSLTGIVIEKVRDNLVYEFEEPQYGWYGFDEEAFNDRLYEELSEIFGYRE